MCAYARERVQLCACATDATGGASGPDRTQRCPECGETVSLGKLRRVEARVSAGSEDNSHVLAFAATPALNALLKDATYVHVSCIIGSVIALAFAESRTSQCACCFCSCSVFESRCSSGSVKCGITTHSSVRIHQSACRWNGVYTSCSVIKPTEVYS